MPRCSKLLGLTFFSLGPRRALAKFSDTGVQLNSTNAVRNYAELRTFLDDIYVCRLSKAELVENGSWNAIRRKRNEVIEERQSI